MKDVFILDGAMGTSLWKRAGDHSPVWQYNMKYPQTVIDVHREYIAAGSNIILTNTFGANKGAVSRYERSVFDVVSEGVRLAKAAAEGTNTKIALSVGPLSVLLEPYGDLTEEEAEEIYREQIGAGMSEHPDIIFLETFMDIEMMKVAAHVAREFDAMLFCSMTFEPVGRTMMGNTVDDVIEGLKDLSPDAIGLNCSLGPESALPIIESFKEKTDIPLLFKPNAGKPQVPVGGISENEFNADVFAGDAYRAAQLGVKYVGGCCGTDPEYIRKLAKKIRSN